VKRLAIFAHYDPQCEVKPYILFHLKALRDCCERVAFVSTAALSDQEMAKVSGLCDEVHLRPNVGYDFGMWQFVIAHTDLSVWDEIVLTNSSVFGPFWPLTDAFQRMADQPCDFWGMTDSYQHDWHIQSYFLVFRHKVIRSEAFATFWRSVLPYTNKRQTIRSYEIGLTEYLAGAGFTSRVLAPTLSLLPKGILRYLFRKYRKYKRRNPAVIYARELLKARMPFMKLELFKRKPALVARALRGFDYDLSGLQSNTDAMSVRPIAF
jgi:rhamnosyltransferase